jgi:hypothetical protein
MPLPSPARAERIAYDANLDFGNVWLDTLAIVRCYEPSIERIAEALLRRGSLSGADIHCLLTGMWKSPRWLAA